MARAAECHCRPQSSAIESLLPHADWRATRRHGRSALGHANGRHPMLDPKAGRSRLASLPALRCGNRPWGCHRPSLRALAAQTPGTRRRRRTRRRLGRSRGGGDLLGWRQMPRQGHRRTQTSHASSGAPSRCIRLARNRPTRGSRATVHCRLTRGSPSRSMPLLLVVSLCARRMAVGAEIALEEPGDGLIDCADEIALTQRSAGGPHAGHRRSRRDDDASAGARRPDAIDRHAGRPGCRASRTIRSNLRTPVAQS